jgi:hypothetical protein
MHSAALSSHTLSATTATAASGRRAAGPVPQAARGPDGFSSVESYDAERLKLDAQVGTMLRSGLFTVCVAVTTGIPLHM